MTKVLYWIFAISMLGLVAALNGGMQFHEVAQEAGIDHVYEQPTGTRFGDLGYEWMTGGAVAEDFDGDGWVDLYVLQGGVRPNLMYMNQRDGTFRDEAEERGVDVVGVLVGVAAADYDRDGDIDIFVTATSAPHYLLKNNGSGFFLVETVNYAPTNWATSPSWGDLNNDGYLDLAIGAWVLGEEDINIRINEEGKLRYSQGLVKSYNFTPIFADLNGDRYQDLVAVADIGQAGWFFNNGSGILLPGEDSDIDFGMGGAVGDIDNDGDLDLFMTSIYDEESNEKIRSSTGNRLLLNDGSGAFSDVTDVAGVREGFWGWGAIMADFDNDGDLDIFHVNGWQDTRGSNATTRYADEPARLFENLGEVRFMEVAEASGIGDSGQGRSAIAFDYDRDGDLDVFIVNHYERRETVTGEYVTEPGRPRLYRNDTPQQGNWLNVYLAGRSEPHHTHGIGSRVYVETDTTVQMRELNANSGYNGHGPHRIAHFGLGDAEVVNRVRTVWPNGDEVIVEIVGINQDLVIKSPLGNLSAREVRAGGSLQFSYPLNEVGAAVAVWRIDGSNYIDGSIIPVLEAGTKTLEVDVFEDEEMKRLLRTERMEVTVLPAVNVTEYSIARVWNEEALDAIRIDFPNPGVHARNLFHLSIAMWDIWAAYHWPAQGYLTREAATASRVDSALDEAISYAAYRLLSARYKHSINASTTQALLDDRMRTLGYKISVEAIDGDSPAALGNRIAQAILDWSASDGSREATGYDDPGYAPVNEPMDLQERGTHLLDFNRWQPLEFEVAMTQNGLVTSNVQIFQGSHWGWVRAFAMPADPEGLHYDPGAPPQLGTPTEDAYIDGSVAVLRYSSWLDPDDEVMIDISPVSRGMNSLGLNDGNGHGSLPNPFTGQPYEQNWVKRGDFARVIAEFWADGPRSETPPGHWNTLANAVADHSDHERRYRGVGPELDPLEWDVKVYFMLNAALHDAAIAAWGCKRYYDYIRPISSIRHLAQVQKLPIIPGLIEQVTAESSGPGERHYHLLAEGGQLGDMAVYTWGGEPEDKLTEHTGTEWILAENWLPYQRDTFVTPAFAGYVSGHSAFSRAAAEVLTYITGSPYFPGGMATHTVPRGHLEFEFGPSETITLQWARYFDASDEAGLSRLYGGIHVPADDGPGRVMGSMAGLRAIALAEPYFTGEIFAEPVAPLVTFSDGEYTLQIAGIPGAWYLLEVSNDLLEWRPLGSWQWMADVEVSRMVEATGEPLYFRVLYREVPTE
jgi:hypothetical protein